MDKNKLREVIMSGRFEWRKHALQRLLERGIKREDVINVIIRGEEIEEYPTNKPYSSALFMGWSQDKPLHVVVALNGTNEWAYIITAYEPSLNEFESDFKTRRKRS